MPLKTYTGARTQTGYLFVLPLPPKQLSPNARCHYLAKAKAVKTYRRDCGLVALSVLNLLGANKPRWERATAKIGFYFRTPARRDEDNALASLKACFDGLADAGIVANDSGLSPRIELMAVDKKNPRVVIVVEPDAAVPMLPFTVCGSNENVVFGLASAERQGRK